MTGDGDGRWAKDSGEVFEAAAFLCYFNDLPDAATRQGVYPLDEVLPLALLAVLAGTETFTDIARFGEKSLPYCAGSARSAMERRRTTASANFFATLDADHFQRCFVAWVALVTGIPAGVIASAQRAT
jgi:hypothetical protein